MREIKIKPRMKYTKEDVTFNFLSPQSFENLCYDLLVKYNFHNLIWRKGGADNGRDIEANYTFRNMIKTKETKWFFECKHYTSGGVPPEHLYSKIAWADAELPNYLVIFISSYLSNGARTWLEKISKQKAYDIICIEGEHLKERLLNHSDLVERYFSLNRYDKMLKDIKDYKIKYDINPSFEILKEIIENISIKSLDVEDFGFILLSFFSQYRYFEARNEHYGDFNDEIINRLLVHLKETNINEEALNSFLDYGENYDELNGYGILDEFWVDDANSHNESKYKFQHFNFHLNSNLSQEKWKIGYYLFIIYEHSLFEIFMVERVEIRIIRNFCIKKISLITPHLHPTQINRLKSELEIIGMV